MNDLIGRNRVLRGFCVALLVWMCGGMLIPLAEAARSTYADYVVEGFVADGGAILGNPVPVAGVDGSGNVQTVAVNSDGAISVAPAAASTQTVVGPAADGAAVSGNPVRIAGKDGSGNTQDIATDTSGNQVVVGAGAAGTANAGVVTVQGIASMTPIASSQSGTWTVQPGNTANTTPWLMSQYASTAGGATPYYLISANTTNDTNVKASAGQVYAISASNVNAAVRYLKLYNKASAPTVGTDTPVAVFAIPGATTGGVGTLSIDCGIAFATGIGFGTTTGVADNDTGAVAANEIVVNLFYK